MIDKATKEFDRKLQIEEDAKLATRMSAPVEFKGKRKKKKKKKRWNASLRM